MSKENMSAKVKGIVVKSNEAIEKKAFELFFQPRVAGN